MNKKFKSDRLQQAIKDFHDSIYIEKINRQLNGIKPSKVIAPTIDYELSERVRTVRLFSQATDMFNKKALYPLRMSFMKILAQFCRRRENLCRLQMRCSCKIDTLKTSTNRIKKPTGQDSETTLPFCPFCRWVDNQVG